MNTDQDNAPVAPTPTAEEHIAHARTEACRQRDELIDSLRAELNAIRQQHAEEVAGAQRELEQLREARSSSVRVVDEANADRAAALARQAELQIHLSDIHDIATLGTLADAERLAAIADRTRTHHTPV